MNKLIRLSSTGIEYGDYAWNFISGCSNNIGGLCRAGGFKCWAYSISQRFESHYPNGFKPTIYPEAFCSPLYLKKPSRILCAFMGDLFGGGFNPDEKIEATMPSGKASVAMSLKGWIFTTIRQCPQHTFLFLTKQPQNLLQWSPFPDNCWPGVTATDGTMFWNAGWVLRDIEAKVKLISIEPLLGWLSLGVLSVIRFVDWIIIGACTGMKPELVELNKRYPELTLMPWGKKWTLQPPISWVEKIINAADRAGVKVFLENNLKPLLEIYDITDTNFGRLTSLNTEAIKDAQGLPRQRGWYDLRQEIPE